MIESICPPADTRVLWEPMGDGKRVISLAENHVLLWDLQESSSKATISSSATLEGKGQLKFTAGKWSPHHNSTQLATANDTAIRGWDLRSMSFTPHPQSFHLLLPLHFTLHVCFSGFLYVDTSSVLCISVFISLFCFFSRSSHLIRSCKHNVIMSILPNMAIIESPSILLIFHVSLAAPHQLYAKLEKCEFSFLGYIISPEGVSMDEGKKKETRAGLEQLEGDQIYCIENAHGQLVRDLDFNPNKQYYLSSCGDDCKVKFWDVRHINEPVKSLEEHSHWVWSVRYNHSHDQLLLTGSSDSRVILSNMVSISSEPFGHLVDDDDLSDTEENQQEDKGKEPLQDSIISTYEEHEDSVYAVEWSAADPWLFASLSYDGRLVINRVPRALKYRILL
ncbi:hypothetical protein PO909_011240 [Leuciscus waleckii]